jgi:hypothetical protein
MGNRSDTGCQWRILPENVSYEISSIMCVCRKDSAIEVAVIGGLITRQQDPRLRLEKRAVKSCCMPWPRSLRTIETAKASAISLSIGRFFATVLILLLHEDGLVQGLHEFI